MIVYRIHNLRRVSAKKTIRMTHVESAQYHHHRQYLIWTGRDRGLGEIRRMLAGDKHKPSPYPTPYRRSRAGQHQNIQFCALSALLTRLTVWRLSFSLIAPWCCAVVLPCLCDILQREIALGYNGHSFMRALVPPPFPWLNFNVFIPALIWTSSLGYFQMCLLFSVVFILLCTPMCCNGFLFTSGRHVTCCHRWLLQRKEFLRVGQTESQAAVSSGSFLVIES